MKWSDTSFSVLFWGNAWRSGQVSNVSKTKFTLYHIMSWNWMYKTCFSYNKSILYYNDSPSLYYKITGRIIMDSITPIHKNCGFTINIMLYDLYSYIHLSGERNYHHPFMWWNFFLVIYTINHIVSSHNIVRMYKMRVGIIPMWALHKIHGLVTKFIFWC